MSLRRVQVTDFRCLRPATLELHPRFSLISGPNASGKTSLLECIYVLGRGRSFRTRRMEQLIQTGQERFLVVGEVEFPDRRATLGVEGSALGVRAKIQGERPASLAELALLLPVQIIDPEVHRLIEEGPGRRRRFLDWGVFHVEPTYVGHWQRYQLALRQRNAALRGGQSPAATAAWDAELIRRGEAISASRQRYLDLLEPQAVALTKALLGRDLSMSYRPGWPRDRTLAEATLDNRLSDRESGFTQAGPHRAELGLRLDGMIVKDRISRGQQKLLAASLLLAQLRLFPTDAPAQPTLLLDDPAAELDGERLEALIREVSRDGMQLIATSLSADFAPLGQPGHHLQVAEGRVTLKGDVSRGT